MGYRPEQRSEDYLAVGPLRRGQAALGSDPGQVSFAELGEDRRGGLVAER